MLGSLIYFIGLVLSTQRTSLLQPLIVLAVWRLFTYRSGTRVFYTVAVFSAVLLISLSNVLLNSLEPVDNVLRSVTGEQGWAAQVLRVSTFADRLKGWTRLTRPDSYTLFGTKEAQTERVNYSDDDYSHDMVNSVLINHGVIGLLACAVVLVIVVRKTHAMVFRVENTWDRSTLAFILANLSINLLLTLLGGSNIQTVPINLIFATMAGHAVAILARTGSALTTAPADAVPPNAVAWGAPMRPPAGANPGWRGHPGL